MPIIICDKTGIPFEGTKRQKNHPRVSALLNSAHKAGTYNVALARLEAAKAAGMTDIDAVIAYVHSGENAALQARAAEQARRQQEDEQRTAAVQARRITNEFLRSCGFRWVNAGFESEEDADFYAGFATAEIGKVWRLEDPEGRPTSLRAAMERLAEAGYGQAKAWLHNHPGDGL